MRPPRRFPLSLIFLPLLLTILSACAIGNVTETGLPTAIRAISEGQLPTVTSPPRATETVAPTPTEAEPTVAPVNGIAAVNQVAVSVAEEPLAVQVTASGTVPDGCTEINDTTVEQDGAVFLATITTLRDPDAICTQALVPFVETFDLDVTGLEPGNYEVQVNGVGEPFKIPGAAPATQEPPRELTPTPTVSISPRNGPVGATVQLTAIGLPANSTVNIGIGPPESEFEVIDQVFTDSSGRLILSTTVPNFVKPGEEWLFVVQAGEQVIISEPFTVMAGMPGDGRGGWNIYLIALEDGGQSGEEVGCGDSVVPVSVNVGRTPAPLRATLERLLTVDETFYGESGLYNALEQSNLQVQGINIRNGIAIIHLSGELIIGGVCDSPRVQAQLEQTALQFSTVNAVEISINGTPLEELLSGQ